MQFYFCKLVELISVLSTLLHWQLQKYPLGYEHPWLGVTNLNQPQLNCSVTVCYWTSVLCVY